MMKKLYYEEWSLEDDVSPGWKLISQFVESIRDKAYLRRGWFFLYDDVKKEYVLTSKFEQFREKEACKILNLLHKDAVSILCFKKNGGLPITDLTKNYRRCVADMLREENFSEVFPDRLNDNQWRQLESDEFHLILHHDGDPIFLVEFRPDFPISDSPNLQVSTDEQSKNPN